MLLQNNVAATIGGAAFFQQSCYPVRPLAYRSHECHAATTVLQLHLRRIPLLASACASCLRCHWLLGHTIVGSLAFAMDSLVLLGRCCDNAAICMSASSKHDCRIFLVFEHVSSVSRFTDAQ